MAATVTANPTSDDAVSGTWTGAGGSRYTVVDDYPDTGGTDELTHGTTAGNLTFGFSAFSIPSIATSITVFVDYYDYKTASQGATFGARLKVGGNYYNATTHNPANGTRTQRTDTWTNNPKTAAAWTPAQVNRTDGTNDLQAFGYNSSDASPTVVTSSIRVRVEYTATYTLTAAQASFAETGNAAGLNLGLTIAAAQASFTLTGNAATLTYNPAGATLVAATGTFAHTGNAAGLLLGARVAAGQGAFAETGFAVNLNRALRFVVDQASFTLTGNAAGLAYSGGATLIASTGTFAHTGQAANVLRGAVVAAAQASFALTGNSAGLTAQLRMAADSGSLTLTGQSVAFQVYLPIQTHALSLNGYEVSWLKLSRLPATQAALTISGSARLIVATVTMYLDREGAAVVISNDASVEVYANPADSLVVVGNGVM